MVEKSSYNCCKFCGWKFPSDLIEAINENRDFLFCELCGAEIRYNNVKCQENDEVIKNVSESDLNGNTDKSKSSLWKHFYETIKKFIIENEEGEIQERLTKKEKECIIRVYKDPDFTQIFKSNFIIVLARITYYEFEKLKSTANLKKSKRKLINTELKTLLERLKPIINKSIKAEFLENLHNISQKDFEEWLIKLQDKLKSNPNHCEDFIIYINWLIKEVVIIITELWNKPILPKFEQTILNDLKKQFPFKEVTNVSKENKRGKVKKLETIIKENNKKRMKIESKNYNLLDFIEDLRQEIQKILPINDLLYEKRLTDAKLSNFLGQIEKHILYIKKNYKRNPKFQLNLELLREYKESLLLKFGDNCKKAIDLIIKYMQLNSLRREARHIYNYHPNIKLDYFKYIDTKEKAYWLGLIYADGGLSFKTFKKKFIRFSFGLSLKDKESRDMVYRLAKTLGIEEKHAKPCSRGVLLRFSITNNIFGLNLKKHGVIIGKEKSKNIKLPELGSRELNLAFLLGYYDGDGTKGSTVITSGSKKFLEQIKEKYNIEYELRYKKSESIINGRKVAGKGWSLALGAKLFNEMIKNYQFSMPSKRKIFETPEEKSERAKQQCIQRAKLKITEDFLENLKKLVWEMPLYKIADIYNIGNNRIGEICKKYKIDKPPIGYWKKKRE